MEEVKQCERCGKLISAVWNADYYSHIRVKYCDACRKVAYAEKHAEAQKRYRQKKRVRRDAGNDCFDITRAYEALQTQYLSIMEDRISELQELVSEVLLNG